MDPEHVTGDRGRELPAVELGAEVVWIVERELAALAVGSVGRLARRREQALALLPGRLREQLLGPEAEPGRARVDADLVAALAPACAELQTELEAGIPVLAAAGLHHLRGAVEEALQLDAQQRRGDEPEHRESRVAAADLRLAGEHGAEAALGRDALELGAGIGDRRELRSAAAGALPEVLQVRARLERRARLRGDEEERPLEVESASSRRIACG